MSKNENSNLTFWVISGFVVLSIIGSCTGVNNSTSTYTPSTTSSYPPVKNDYEDMRSRGHSEEDAVIFSILKQQGYSDYDALNATKSSKQSR